MARPEKAAAVEEITSRFGEAGAALLTEYRGLTVTEIADVRNALREADADYKVMKNTLVRIAAQEIGLADLAGLLTGPTAIAFCRGDAVAAAKALDEAAKRFPVLVVKGGVLNGKILDADQTRALASIESREVLLSKIAMLVNQPAQQTVNVLAALLRNLGSMLAQVVEQKGAEAPTETPQAAPEEAPEAEQPPAVVPEGNGTSALGGAVAQDQAPAAPDAQDQAPAAPDADVATTTEENEEKE